MGTWNATSFGNDTAMDWLSDLASHTNGRALIESTLSRIESVDYAEAPHAEEAIAAAAVIAAAATDPIGAIGADTKRWIRTSGFAPNLELLDSALLVIAAVRGQSELRDLWEESGDLKAWLKQVETLRDRIQKARDVGVPARTPKVAGIPRSLHKLVAFYSTQPSPDIREKIRAKVYALKDPDGQSADTDFQPPLTLMARHGLLEETRHLLARGANPNLGSSRAFAEACTAGHLDIARALIAYGATLFHEHRMSPELGIVLPVEIKDADERVQGHRYCLALFSVSRAGTPSAADYLRELGANLDQTDLNGETLLHKAAESGCVQMIHYLLDEGLDPDRVKGDSGESALHYATRAGKFDSVRALLERGANPNLTDRFDGEVHQWCETPLDIADLPEIRSLLIAQGARTGKEVSSGDKG